MKRTNARGKNEMIVQYKIVNPKGKEVKDLKPNKDIRVNVVSVRQYEIGNIIKDQILEITLQMRDHEHEV